MSNRDATSTIKGYLYQFETAIKNILVQEDENTCITLEGIEDIDVSNASQVTAIQCKYHEGTKYAPSAIRKPINLMFNHFIENYGSIDINYYLYAYFKENSDAFVSPITLEFLKGKIFTFKKSGVDCRLHEELNVTDNQIIEFIERIVVDVNAPEFLVQNAEISELIVSSVGCPKTEIKYYFNEAVNIILKMSIENDVSLRTISKKDFVSRIKSGKEELYSSWLREYNTTEEYNKFIRKKYFSKLNHSNLEHIFIIDGNVEKTLNMIIKVIELIHSKYTHNSKREPNPRGPIILFHNFEDQEIIEIKNHFCNNNFVVIDGYPYTGSSFKAKKFNEIDSDIKILRSINSIEELKSIISSKGTRFEVLIFQFNNIDFQDDRCEIKRINISNINQVKDII